MFIIYIYTYKHVYIPAGYSLSPFVAMNSQSGILSRQCTAYDNFLQTKNLFICCVCTLPCLCLYGVYPMRSTAIFKRLSFLTYKGNKYKNVRKLDTRVSVLCVLVHIPRACIIARATPVCNFA